MANQPKYESYEAAPGFPRDMVAQHPPPGTFARDAPLARPPQPALDRALLSRGQTMYTAICAPCHGLLGDGDGMIVRRGFPAPPSFHTDALRQARDGHFYQVISHGFGLMYPYANRVDPPDRWAVIAYIRALQLSQHAEVAALPPAMRAELSPPGGTPP